MSRSDLGRVNVLDGFLHLYVLWVRSGVNYVLFANQTWNRSALEIVVTDPSPEPPPLRRSVPLLSSLILLPPLSCDIPEPPLLEPSLEKALVVDEDRYEEFREER